MNEVNNENNQLESQQVVPNVQPQPVPVQPEQTVEPVQPIQQEPQQSPEPNNNKKSNNVLIICITIIIVAIIAGVTVYFLTKPSNDSKPNNDKTKQTEKENNKKETTIPDNNTSNDNTKEVEVSNPDSYKYLIDRLGGPLPCGSSYGVDISTYLNLSNITDSFKFLNAIDNLEAKKYTIKKTDQFYGTTYDNISSKDEDGTISGYSASDVENEVKKIYGKNVTIDYKKAISEPYAYDITTKVYFMAGGMGCGGHSIIQIIDKVTTKGNELYIYVNVGTLEYILEEGSKEESKLYYDYVKTEDLDKTTTKYIYDTAIDKKYTLKEKRDDEVIESIDYEQYIKDNKDKFAEYKYTFEKEDNNYIIKGLEKVK